MATVLRCKIFSVLKTASRACILLKPQSFSNVRSLATSLVQNPIKNMNVHQCLLLVENRLNSKGRLSGYELDYIVQAVQSKGELKSNQALLLIRCCGVVAAGEKPEVRVAYANKVWDILKSSGVELDISHYNAFLKVHIENEQPLVWSEYLKTIEDQGLAPNRVTFQFFLTYYCLMGDLEGATEVLEEMKKREFLLNENIFNALVLGHCINNDVSGAEGILDVMKEKGILVTGDTYSMILCGLAKSGNIEKMRSVMKECSEKNIELRNSKLIDVVYYLFINGNREFAEEILRDMVERDPRYQDMFILLFRLLHKKKYEDYLVAMDILFKEDELFDRMKLAFRYIGNREDFDTILQFKEECEKKGLKINVMKNVLYYVLMSNNMDKALQVIDYLEKSGEPIKLSYFTPLLIKASEEGHISNILRLLQIMTFNYNLNLSAEFISRNVFDRLNAKTRQIDFLLSGLNVRFRPNLSYNAFLKSSLDKDNEEHLYIISKRLNSAIPLNDSTITSMAKYLMRGSKPEIIYDILKNWAHRQNLAVKQESSESDSSQEDETLSKLNENNFQMIIDKLAIRIFRICNRSVTEDFLNFTATNNLPISSKVLDFIRGKLDAQSSGAGINDQEAIEMEEEISSQYKDTKETNQLNFARVLKLGNPDECIKYFEETEEIQNHQGYRKLIERLRVCNADELVEACLKKYYEKFSQEGESLPTNFYVEAEMIRRGMFKEAIELMGKRKSVGNFLIVADLVATIFENAKEDKLQEIFTMENSLSKKLMSLQNIIDALTLRGLEEKALKHLAAVDPQKLVDVDLHKKLLPTLCNKGKIELMEKLITILEEKSNVRNFSSEIVFMCACIGNIKKGRAVLDSEPIVPEKWMSYMYTINGRDSIKVLENAIAILKGYETVQKKKLYNYLILKYENYSESPEKVLDLWVELQEENIQPSPRFLNSMASILKKHGRDVPFQVPPLKNTVKQVEVPRSFPSSLKDSITSYINKEETHLIRNGLINDILAKKLRMDHIETILDFNKYRLNNKTKNVLVTALDFFKWKEEYDKGSLPDYVESLPDLTPEKALSLPLTFLNNLFGLNVQCSNKVSAIILWAHLQNKPEYEKLLKLLEPIATELTTAPPLLKLVLGQLEKNQYNSDVQSILSFMLSRNVFGTDESLKMKAESILNSTVTEDSKGQKTRSSKTKVNEDLTFSEEFAAAHEDEFSFTNIMEDETHVQNKKEVARNPEKPEENVESSDIVQAEKTTSGSSQNL